MSALKSGVLVGMMAAIVASIPLWVWIVLKYIRGAWSHFDTLSEGGDD